ncbi:MAG: erythromycin biosynthesis sensory transduction protein eryC1 [Candidatus Rokuibacteriota bacterium]|nr:MAG: erythromycin biosynthesis sensory transduction protein eryC1 [Candidatus Rokubacteria bacterium]
MTGIDQIPFTDLSLQHAGIRDELAEAFDRVVGSSGFILGQEVERFEQAFAAYCGVRHCVGVASGTAALTLSLEAAGIGPGDEVIVPAHTFIASALGVVHAGATPVLCDVEEGTGLIDPESAAAAVSERTAAIVPVHLYGQLCDMRAVQEIADRHGLFVLEDSAQAHGAADDGRRAGSFGRAAAFSFYPSKNLGALGDGGAITTDDSELAERVRALRDLGQRTKGEHRVAGFNERLDGLQAALLSVKLPYLDRWNEARRERAQIYLQALGEEVMTLENRGTCVYHLFPVRVAGRDELGGRLNAAAIASGVHYSPALHRQPALEGLVGQPVPLARAEEWAREELSLPIFPEMKRVQIERVTGICRTPGSAR